MTPTAKKTITEPANDEVQPTFTEAFEALSDITERLRSEVLPLEESLTLFETGMGHLKTCQTVLSQSKGKLETLTAELDQVLPLDV